MPCIPGTARLEAVGYAWISSGRFTWMLVEVIEPPVACAPSLLFHSQPCKPYCKATRQHHE